MKRKTNFAILILICILSVFVLFSCASPSDFEDSSDSKENDSYNVENSDFTDNSSDDSIPETDSPSTEDSVAGGTTSPDVEAPSDPEQEPHIHNYEFQETVTDPTCVANGEKKKSCVCGEFIIEDIPATGAHSYTDKACITCGKRQPSQGLIFEENDREGAYTLVGIGDCKDKEIVVPETYLGLPVTEIGNRVFENNTDITSVYIPEGVSGIYTAAFAFCTSLESVTLPSSLSVIAFGAFNGCTGLTRVNYLGDIEGWCNITFVSPNPLEYAGNLYINGELLEDLIIPETVTKINDYAFAGCTSIKSITIPGKGLESIGNNSFARCVNIKTATAPVSSFANIYCASIQNLTINGGETIDNEFFSNRNELTNLVIGDSVKIIGRKAFYDCEYLASITISKGLTGIGLGAFENCERITDVYYTGNVEDWCSIAGTIPVYGANLYINGELVRELIIPDTVTEIKQNAFYGCRSIEKLIIPSSVTEIKSSAFMGCDRLVEVYNLSSIDMTSHFSNVLKIHTTMEEVSIIDYVDDFAFADIDGKYYFLWRYGNEKELILPENYKNGNYEIYKNAFKNDKILSKIVIPDCVTSIGQSAFKGCISLRRLTVGTGLESVGGSSFAGCLKLVEIYNLSDLDISMYINDAKIVHTSLEEETILQEFDGYVFAVVGDKYYLVAYEGNETMLVLPEISNNVTYEIYRYAFINSLAVDIVIPEGVSAIGQSAFENCFSLTSISIPDSVASIGIKAFYGCKQLVSVSLPNSLTVIEESTFFNCNFLLSVSMGDNVKTIGASAFCNCSSLRNVVLPYNLKKIESGAFSKCSSITSITIPRFVAMIERNAFSNCTSLESIKFEVKTAWYISNTASGTAFDVSNPESNAHCIVWVNKNYNWYRK